MKVIWRDERTTIRRGSLIRLVVMGGLIIAGLTLCAGIIVSAIFGTVPMPLLAALLVLWIVRLAVSIFDVANRYVRRRARQLRMHRR